MTLAEYIADRNAATLAWIAEDPDNRWAGLIVDDLAFWAEMGIHTVAQYKRHDLEALVWDMYKDAMGFRPRHIDFSSMTDEELEAEADSLGRMIERQIQEEEDYSWEDEDTSGWPRLTEEEEVALAEAPEPIDYVAANYQDGWL